jgi:hypothetical protein
MTKNAIRRDQSWRGVAGMKWQIYASGSVTRIVVPDALVARRVMSPW